MAFSIEDINLFQSEVYPINLLTVFQQRIIKDTLTYPMENNEIDSADMQTIYLSILSHTKSSNPKLQDVISDIEYYLNSISIGRISFNDDLEAPTIARVHHFMLWHIYQHLNVENKLLVDFSTLPTIMPSIGEKPVGSLSNPERLIFLGDFEQHQFSIYSTFVQAFQEYIDDEVPEKNLGDYFSNYTPQELLGLIQFIDNHPVAALGSHNDNELLMKHLISSLMAISTKFDQADIADQIDDFKTSVKTALTAQAKDINDNKKCLLNAVNNKIENPEFATMTIGFVRDLSDNEIASILSTNNFLKPADFAVLITTLMATGKKALADQAVDRLKLFMKGKGVFDQHESMIFVIANIPDANMRSIAFKNQSLTAYYTNIISTYTHLGRDNGNYYTPNLIKNLLTTLSYDFEENPWYDTIISSLAILLGVCLNRNWDKAIDEFNNEEDDKYRIFYEVISNPAFKNTREKIVGQKNKLRMLENLMSLVPANKLNEFYRLSGINNIINTNVEKEILENWLTVNGRNLRYDITPIANNLTVLDSQGLETYLLASEGYFAVSVCNWSNSAKQIYIQMIRQNKHQKLFELFIQYNPMVLSQLKAKKDIMIISIENGVPIKQCLLGLPAGEAMYLIAHSESIRNHYINLVKNNDHHEVLKHFEDINFIWDNETKQVEKTVFAATLQGYAQQETSFFYVASLNPLTEAERKIALDAAPQDDQNYADYYQSVKQKHLAAQTQATSNSVFFSGNWRLSSSSRAHAPQTDLGKILATFGARI